MSNNEFQLLNHPEVLQLIQLALNEDAFNDDLTTKAASLGSGFKTKTRATILAKKETVACGFPLIQKIVAAANVDGVQTSCFAEEGSTLKSNQPWILMEGPSQDLLALERTILNFLIRMCGIAHFSREIAVMLEGTQCKLLHTRKTAPGHRRTDVYACLTGGAQLHRISLNDAILVKENHIRVSASLQSLDDGIQALRKKGRFVEIEVTNLTELKYALASKPDRIMLDNFTPEEAARAVDLFGSSVALEASGMINKLNARSYADAGVDFISLGSLTHSAPAADLSMLFDFY